MDATVRDLPCQRPEMDEISSFVGKEEKAVRKGEQGFGNVWTWCGIDAHTKLVPAFMTGDRTPKVADAFVADVASRVRNWVQVSADRFYAYAEAME